MKKFAFSIIMSLLFVCTMKAQSKVFKEVGEDISTQVKAISQDNGLVGYLAFTRLEKADLDSFNYRVTIMDENLNDIGTVNFRQGILDLQAVSFEQNVLCLGYIDAAASGHIFLQFINLDGKVINNYYREANLSRIGYLKYGMQIKNIPNGGFAFFYGDDVKQQLAIFDIKGNLTHEQEAPTVADHFFLRTSATEIYLLTKHDIRVPEGGSTLYVYSAKDLDAENNFDLRDGYDNWLKVLSFDNDPATGDAFIAGCIINPDGNRNSSGPAIMPMAPTWVCSHSIWEIRIRTCMPIAVTGPVEISPAFPGTASLQRRAFTSNIPRHSKIIPATPFLPVPPWSERDLWGLPDTS